MQEYKLICEIGRGVHGTVYKAEGSNGLVAIKQVDVSDGPTAQLIKEVDIMSRSSHPNIVTLHQVIWEREKMKVRIVMELADMDMGKWVEGKRPKGVDIMNVAKEMFLALAFLEENNIITGDLKPQNVLLFDNTIKLADYGLAEFVNASPSDNILYTIYYRAPEILKEDVYTTKCDVWAAGCTLYELLTGTPLFPYLRELSLMKAHKEFTKVRRRHAICSITETNLTTLYDLIDSCIVVSAKKRPLATEILKRFFGHSSSVGKITNMVYPNVTTNSEWFIYRGKKIDEMRSMCKHFYIKNPHVWLLAATLTDRIALFADLQNNILMACLYIACLVVESLPPFIVAFIPYTTYKEPCELEHESSRVLDLLQYKIFYPNQITLLCDTEGEEKAYNFITSLK